MDIYQKRIIKSLKKIGIKASNLEVPPDPKLGDYALPCYQYAKELKKDPRQIASEIKGKIGIPDGISKIIVNGPYLNFYVENKEIIHDVLANIIKDGSNYGSNYKGKGKSALIEHTSINPNASPHVGRARNSLIGDSLARVLRFQGYQVETHFYVNDVGKQIAMLVLSSEGKKPDFNELLSHYIEINILMERNSDLEVEVFRLLRKFEDRDEKTVKRFKEIVNVCIEGQVRILSDLGINFDKFDYESKFLFNNDVNKVLARLKKTHALFEDGEKRFVLDQQKYDLGMKNKFLVLTRADKTSLYPLRDLAYTIEKFSKKFDLNIIVLGEDQKLYSDQLKYALSSINEDYPTAVHYSFVLLEDGKMSTRKGNLVLLSDFMDEAFNKAKEEINKRHGIIDEDAAKKIAYGSIKLSILRVSAEKNVIFNWQHALNFEGDSGPYIQYSYARICSIFKKSGDKFDINAELKYLKQDIELRIVKLLSKFPSIVEDAAINLRVHVIANYLIELAKLFNEFYNDCPILKEKKAVMNSRLVLSFCVKQVLKNGMNLLGMEEVEKM